MVLAPMFSDYIRGLHAFDARICGVGIMDLEAADPQAPAGLALGLPALVSPVSGRAVGCLLNNPHNPSGRLFAKSEILACLEQFALVVVDEAFMDFLPGEAESVIPWVQQFPNLVVVRSLTKFYSLPGLRLGYAIAHPDRLRRWQQWRDPWSVNALAAAVGEVVIQDRDFQQQTWDWLAVAKPQLFQGLAPIPGLAPAAGSANFLLVRSDVAVPQLQVDLLKRDRILIRDCMSFAELGDRYFRVAVRTLSENQRLITALATILCPPTTI